MTAGDLVGLLPWWSVSVISGVSWHVLRRPSWPGPVQVYTSPYNAFLLFFFLFFPPFNHACSIVIFHFDWQTRQKVASTEYAVPHPGNRPVLYIHTIQYVPAYAVVLPVTQNRRLKPALMCLMRYPTHKGTVLFQRWILPRKEEEKCLVLSLSVSYPTKKLLFDGALHPVRNISYIHYTHLLEPEATAHGLPLKEKGAPGKKETKAKACKKNHALPYQGMFREAGLDYIVLCRKGGWEEGAPGLGSIIVHTTCTSVVI